MDQWYIEAKQSVEKNSTYSLDAMAYDPISFHYVSEVESSLLYRLLGASSVFGKSTDGLRTEEKERFEEVQTLCPPSVSSSGPRARDVRSVSGRVAEPAVAVCSNWRDILRWWPHTDAAAGHYSRKLSRGKAGEKEAQELFNYLSKVALLLRTSGH